jgi:spermidine synthase
MRRLSFAVLLIALSTLVLELMLTRVFDVVLVPNLAYFVVTSAVFAFGLAGIYATLRPIPVERDISGYLVTRSILFALTTALLIPLINVLPLDYTQLGPRNIVRTMLAFLTLYLVLVLPFFLAGSVLIAVFSKYAQNIQRLYFWDLVGAGLGSIIVIPFIARIGPGGLILAATGLALVAAALFTQSNGTRLLTLLAALVAIAYPFIRAPSYIDFGQHVDKRGVKQALAQGRGEFERWDPISKINVIDETWSPAIAVPWHTSGDRKAIQYDGGNQSSYFYKFDGDLKSLRERLEVDKTHLEDHFWQIGVLASHYLKRDSNQKVLVIGSAGGQETKAALMYGASHVDAVELVPTVVELGTGRYSSYIGDIFQSPRVHVEAGEGRSFLRHTDQRYDIIQMYSNYTSSSIAQGTGALEPAYLQTAEAYEEYFSHLTDNGVLHINHDAFPRMIATAALAWKRMGRTDFQSHVVVYIMPAELPLPTMLIKMQPWTAQEIAELNTFLTPSEVEPEKRCTLVENPIDHSKSFLTPDFYSGDLPQSIADKADVYITARTDNKPYFEMMRKSLRILQPSQATFTDAGTARQVNDAVAYSKGIPMDWIHLIFTGIVSFLFMIAFILVPLRFSSVGGEEGATSVPLLLYFSCLGAGFISLELVFIQKFSHLIGSPLYTYSTVIFTLLFSAGIGSAISEKLRIGPTRAWTVPFIAIIVLGTLLALIYPAMAHVALALSVGGRVLISAAMIFPLGFFLGMPFPLGILAIANHPRGAIAWAWGMNGLFTVAGGFISILISMGYGFNFAIGLALALYALALVLYPRLQRAESAAVAQARATSAAQGPSTA